MIPLKEEPTVNSALCFSDDDAEHLLSCQSTLAQAGNIVIASARHENLLAHYTRTMLAEINRTGGQSSANLVSIKRMPKTSDGLLEALNEHLANLDVAALQAKRVVKTREIWLYELSGPVKSELLQMAAPMIKQFKAAGVSIVVHSRQARPDSAHLQKLAKKLRAKLVVFQTPTAEQCHKLAEAAEGRPEAGQIHQLIRSLGVSVEQDELAETAELPVMPPLSKLMQKAEQSLPANRAGDAQEVPVATPEAKVDNAKKATPTPPLSGVSNVRIILSSGIACLLIAGLYLNPGFDPFEKAGSAAAWLQSQLQEQQLSLGTESAAATAQVVLPIAIPQDDTLVTSPRVVAQAPQNNAQRIESAPPVLETPSQVPTSVVQAAQSAELDAPILDAEESLMTLFPVAAPTEQVARTKPVMGQGPIAFEPGVYVQHASFRLPQSALIWRNNNSQLPGVKVAAKGERFVTVSGPFVDRGQARRYLAEFGITAQPYFVEGEVLRASTQS